MNCINLIKNNFKRILTHKEILAVAIIIVPVFIGIAVIFSERAEMKLSVALVGDISGISREISENNKYKIDVVKERPPESALLMGTYAAVIEQNKDGTYRVETIKSKKEQSAMENYFNTGKMEIENKRGAGTNILGYIFMIMIMQAVALTILYPEDRIKKTFRRIMTAPVSEKQYLFSQGILTVLFLFIPTYVAIVIANAGFGINLGYSLGMMALLLGILTVFSTSFALFISSLIERNTSLAASGIAVITCILAGCFISFSDNNTLLDNVLNLIPQKAYMNMIQGIAGGGKFFNYMDQVIYLMIWIVGFWVIGGVITSHKVKNGIY